LEYYDELIEKIEKSIKELEKEIKELTKKNYQEEYKLLKSIPGVSDRVIGVVISIFGGFKWRLVNNFVSGLKIFY